MLYIWYGLPNLNIATHSSYEMFAGSYAANGTDYTQRMCEAVALDKKIITNNSKINEAPFL